LNNAIYFACPIFAFVVMMYNLVVGFLVSGKGGSSGKGIGSSVGERGYV